MDSRTWHEELRRFPLTAVFRAQAGDRVLKRSGSGWVTLCPFHADRNPSLSITDGQGYNCHAARCDARGRHAVSLMHRFLGGSIAEAEDAVARLAGLPPRPGRRSPAVTGQPASRPARPVLPPSVQARRPDPEDPGSWPVLRPPADAPGPAEAMWMPGRDGQPGRMVSGHWDHVHWYRDLHGQPVMAILRRDRSAGKPKKVRPATWRRRPDGTCCWVMRGLPPGRLRPVFGMEVLGAWERKARSRDYTGPFGTLVAVEGELTALRAREVLGMERVLCPQGGAKVAERADWQPLFGIMARHFRRGSDPSPADIVIWPDADEATADRNPRVENIARVVAGLRSGYRRVDPSDADFCRWVRVRVVKLPDDLPSGWDLGEVHCVTSRVRARARDLVGSARPISGLS